MKITALAPWYGSKRALAAQVLPHLGDHAAYWEPFCGSMAILLAKEPCRQETVNDLHGDLINLAHVIADEEHARELDWRLRRTLVHEGLYRESVERIRDERYDYRQEGISVERAWLFFVFSWMAMNGIGGTPQRSNFARRFTSNGGCPAVRFSSAVDSLPDWHERLSTVAIYHGCGIDLCGKIEDKAGTLIYCDPPYIAKTDSYVHDFASADHLRLAATLQRFQKTRVVVSYYDHPELDRLYPGWRKVDLRAAKNLARGVSPGVAVAPEVLLINNHEQ